MKREILRREVIVVSEASVLKAQRNVTGCFACSQTASFPFDSVLSQVLGNPQTAHFLCKPGFCPRCLGPLFESTLVSFAPHPVICKEDANLVVFVGDPALSRAQSFIAGCEHCAERSEITFGLLLYSLTRCDPRMTDFVLLHPARCPRCKHAIMEKTFVLLNKS